MKYEKLSKLIQDSKNIIFFGGAGVSTESGIPDFRSVDGLYNQKYDYLPEEILSHKFFMNEPAEFYRFYRDKILHLDAKPNMAHIQLSRLEKLGKLRAVVTQNIDNLHQAAGSLNVLELHGSVYRNYCIKCRERYDIKVITERPGVPLCTCGGVIRPDVVLYGEQLDEDIIRSSVNYISTADLVIIGGTSLTVYPAAGLITYTRGKLVIINGNPTYADNEADLCISDKIGAVFAEIDF